MSILAIQVDYHLVKFGINTPISELSAKPIQLKNRWVHCWKIAHNEIESFVSHQLRQYQESLQELAPIQQEVVICGYGVQEQKEFDWLQDLFESILKLKLVKRRSVVNAIQAIDYIIANEKWFYSYETSIPLIQFHTIKQGVSLERSKHLETPSYPYLYVNINKSVSFYKVTETNKYQKLNGSLITDTTLENLFALLGLVGDINDHFLVAFEKGNNINADLTVEDIYGDNCVSLGIPKDIIASSMGKMQIKTELNPYDAVKSIWFLFAINLGQLTALNAQIEELTTVIIGSSKITAEPFLLSLQSTLAFFGQSKLQVSFIENSEYLTCLSL